MSNLKDYKLYKVNFSCTSSLIWLPLSLVFNDFDIELGEAAIRSSCNLDIR